MVFSAAKTPLVGPQELAWALRNSSSGVSSLSIEYAEALPPPAAASLPKLSAVCEQPESAATYLVPRVRIVAAYGNEARYMRFLKQTAKSRASRGVFAGAEQ